MSKPLGVCVLFAGQSVQESGMCRELWKYPAAREILKRLTPFLGDDIERITTEMPDPELALTFNAQRAIHAHHLGHWFAFKAAHPEIAIEGALGHSMGIVAALVAAGAMSVEDSGSFIRVRAQAFSDVCKAFSEPMGLAAISAEFFEDVSSRLSEFPGVSMALHNTIGRGVAGGTLRALENFARKAPEDGWEAKIKLLKVEGPYHTAAFAAARGPLEKALSRIEIRKPQVPVFMGTSGKLEDDPGRIREILVAQADSPELYFQAVWDAYDHGMRRFLEVAYKPQPVTWIGEQLLDENGKLMPGVASIAIKTPDIDAALPVGA